MLTEQQLQQRRIQTCCAIAGCDGLHIPNVPLMRKVVDRIKEDPDSWLQNVWAVAPNKRFSMAAWIGKKVYDPATDQVVTTSQQLTKEACGTAFCIAGHAVMLSDDPLKMITRVKGIPYYGEETKQGYTAKDRAQHELGLTDAEASSLFNGENDWKQVIARMKIFAAVAGDEL